MKLSDAERRITRALWRELMAHWALGQILAAEADKHGGRLDPEELSKHIRDLCIQVLGDAPRVKDLHRHWRLADLYPTEADLKALFDNGRGNWYSLKKRLTTGRDLPIRKGEVVP